MTEPQNTSNDRIPAIFKNRTFDELTPAEWSTALKSLLREEAELDAEYPPHPKVPQHLLTFPNLKLSSFFKTIDRDSTPLMVVMDELRDLPPAVLPVFSAGVDLLVREYLDLFLAKKLRAVKLLDAVLVYENLFEGVMSGALAEEIVLNRNIKSATRRLVVQNLVGRSFSMKVSKQCWKSIQEEVPQVPAFAGAVMEHFIKNGQPGLALRLPLAFKPDANDILTLFEISLALQRLAAQGQLERSILLRYPAWAMEMLRDVWTNALGRNIEDLEALTSE